MSQKKLSVKHLQIDKANQAVLIAIVAGLIIVIFGISVGRAMLIRQAHQSRVIAAKEKAVNQLKINVAAKNQIVESYKKFTSDPINILGGNASAEAVGEKDGDNARLILDALPSKYDFPALAASIEKLFIDRGFAIDSVEGTDDEINQSTVLPQSDPQVIEIPIGIDIDQTNFDGTKRAIDIISRSIRPMQIKKLSLISGQNDEMNIEIDMLTYYLPEKALTITKEEVK